jgi:hypothetical protein
MREPLDVLIQLKVEDLIACDTSIVICVFRRSCPATGHEATQLLACGLALIDRMVARTIEPTVTAKDRQSGLTTRAGEP